MQCAAETDGMRCGVKDGIKRGLCYYHLKMAMKGVYQFWTGRLLDPTRGVEKVINLETGATIYMKGAGK